MDNVTFDGLTRALASPRSRRAVLCGMGALLLGPAPHRAAAAAAPTGFTVTAITMSTDFTGVSPNAINASGAVVGFASTTDATTGQLSIHPMLY